MAKVEVDEAALASQKAIVDLVASIEKNPKLRGDFLRMVKETRPDISIPEIDAAAPVRAELDGVRKELREFLDGQKKEREEAAAKAREDEFANNWNRQRNSLVDAGWMDEGITAVEEFARKRGIPDLEAAAALYEKQNPAYISEPVGRAAFDFFKPDTDTSKAFEDLMKSKGENPAAERALINAALAEVRAGNRR